jgi:high-affinity K+ transport system ATPase subunit B
LLVRRNAFEEQSLLETAVAQRLGIDQILANVSPDQKSGAVNKLQAEGLLIAYSAN